MGAKVRSAISQLEPVRRRWVEALEQSMGEAAALALAEELTVEVPMGMFEAPRDAAPPDQVADEGPEPTEALLLDTLEVMRQRSPLGRLLMAEVGREIDALRALDRLRSIR
jgi:hypothetical protein